MKCFFQTIFLSQSRRQFALSFVFKTCSIFFSFFLHLILKISVIFIGFFKSRENPIFHWQYLQKSYDIIPYLFLSNNQFNQKRFQQFKSSKITPKQIWLNYSSYHFLREVSNDILQLTYSLKQTEIKHHQTWNIFNLFHLKHQNNLKYSPKMIWNKEIKTNKNIWLLYFKSFVWMKT